MSRSDRSMFTTPAIPAWLSQIFGARSHRRKRVRLIWKFVPILLGLACAAYLHPTEEPFLAEELSYRTGRVRQVVACEDGACQIVGANAHSDVAVVIVTHNSATDIAPLIDDLRVAALDTRLRVIVVDNQSSDGTVDMIRRHPDVTLIESNENLGYAGGINARVACAALPQMPPAYPRFSLDSINVIVGMSSNASGRGSDDWLSTTITSSLVSSAATRRSSIKVGSIRCAVVRYDHDGDIGRVHWLRRIWHAPHLRMRRPDELGLSVT